MSSRRWSWSRVSSGLLGGASWIVPATVASLKAMRLLFPAGMGRIARRWMARWLPRPLYFAMVATLVAGVYPAWVSMRIPPALQIKGG